jgi:hypothetical protein
MGYNPENALFDALVSIASSANLEVGIAALSKNIPKPRG